MNNVAIENSTEIYLEEVEEIDSIPEIQVVVNILDFILDVIPRKQKDIILWNAIFDWKINKGDGK